MESKKYIWIALVLMPVFLLPVAFNLSVDESQNFELSTFLGYLLAILLLIPILYFLFQYLKNKTASSYNKLTIDWDKWEKLGKRRFITYRVFFQTIIGFIVSFIIVEAINYFYEDMGRMMLISIIVYTVFSNALVSNNYLWQYHQQKKEESQS